MSATEAGAADQGESKGPARGYSWAPFTAGNEVSLQHGAWSPRMVDPLAREVVAAVLSDPANGHAAQPRHRFALWAFARAEAQVQLLTEYLAKAAEDAGDGIGDLDKDRVRTAYLLLHRAEGRATSGRTRLGLDPLSASRLGRDQAATGADTARMMSELARLSALGVEVPNVDLGDRGGSS